MLSIEGQNFHCTDYDSVPESQKNKKGLPEHGVAFIITLNIIWARVNQN